MDSPMDIVHAVSFSSYICGEDCLVSFHMEATATGSSFFCFVSFGSEWFSFPVYAFLVSFKLPAPISFGIWYEQIGTSENFIEWMAPPHLYMMILEQCS